MGSDPVYRMKQSRNARPQRNVLCSERTVVMKFASSLLSLPALLLALPLAASATIYKWTDADGCTVISNRLPAAEAKVANMQVVVEDEEKPAVAPKAAPAPKPENGNELHERIRALEQQVQALQT